MADILQLWKNSTRVDSTRCTVMDTIIINADEDDDKHVIHSVTCYNEDSTSNTVNK